MGAGPGGSSLAQLRRGTLQYCVLALVEHRELYAYEIVSELSAVPGMVTSEGTLYPLLSRLRKEGLLASSWRESANGPPRRYYRLSSAGEAALADFARQWRGFRAGVDHFIEPGGKA